MTVPGHSMRTMLFWMLVTMTIQMNGVFVHGEIDVEFEQGRLDDARMKWNQKMGNNGYKYNTQRNCFCPPEYTEEMKVHVDGNGNVISVRNMLDMDVNTDVFNNVWPVDLVFDKIQNAINYPAAGLNVHYHPDLGYPQSLFVDLDLQMADEEIFLQITTLCKVCTE